MSFSIYYFSKFDKFLDLEDTRIKEVRYGLFLTALGLLYAVSVPLLHQFIDSLQFNTGIFIFVTGTLMILGLFLVNSGLKAKRIVKKKKVRLY